MTKYNINNIEIEIEIYKSTAGFTKKYPFVLMHGLGCQLISWNEKFIKFITSQGYDVYSFDNRDIGLSTKFDEYDEQHINQALKEINEQGYANNPPYTLYDMAEDTKSVIDHFGFEKVHLYGASMGGLIAQLFGQKYNNSLASIGIIFSSTRADGLPGMSEETIQELTRLPASDSKEDILDFLAKSYLYFGSPKFGANYEATYDRAKREYERNYNPNGKTRQYICANSTKNDHTLNKNITVPALILHGDCDPIFTPEHAESTRDSMPNSNMVIIEGWSHDTPDELADTLGKYVVANADIGE